MARLRDLVSGRLSTLEHEHVVGRSPRSGLRLDDSHVSNQHALLRWTGQRWEVRDLGSRNGTFVDGQRLQPGREHPMAPGTILCFGDLDRRWTLEDDAPPQVMVTPMDEGSPLLAEGNMMGLPSAENPEVTLFRGTDGQWRLERADEVTRVLVNQQQFEADGRVWRFSCPEIVVGTASSDQPAPEMRLLTLRFGVAPDEEHVELRARAGGLTYELGSRGHNYLLLTLARHRLDDASQAQPDPLCGWVYQDDLINALGISPTQLNIDIFRIRKQFAAAGIPDAAAIIERRPGTKQLRIGVARVEIAMA